MISKDYLIILGLLIGASLPSRIGALIFVLLGVGYLLIKNKIKLNNLLIIFLILCTNLFWSLLLNGSKFFMVIV